MSMGMPAVERPRDSIHHPPGAGFRAWSDLSCERLWVVVAVILIVLFRAVLFVFRAPLDFDADQAVMGLMAKHLMEGRAFPLFFYGQNYMLGVEAWFAAPVFLLAGVSVATLKLPLLIINLAAGLLLIRLLERECGLRPSLGLLAGARLGLLAGIAGAVIWLLVSLALDGVIAPLQQRAAEIMLGNATDMPPDVRRWLESVGDRASVPQRLVGSFLFQLFVATPFAALGGLLGTAIVGRQAPPVPGAP